MVHISRYKVRKEVYERINDLFFIIMNRLKRKDAFKQATSELFSPTEKVMFMKRIATIYMVLRGAEYKEISRTLKVSTATVSKFAILFREEDTEIGKIIKAIQKDENTINLLDDLIFNAFNQRGFRKGHWQEYWTHEKRKSQRSIMGSK
jgi:uncharacterized protein YerC